MTNIYETAQANPNFDNTTRLLVEAGVCLFDAMRDAKVDNVELRQAWEKYGFKEMSLFAVDLAWEVDKMWKELPGDRDTRPEFACEFCPAIVAQIDWTKSMPLYCTKGQITGHINQSVKIQMAALAKANAVEYLLHMKRLNPNDPTYDVALQKLTLEGLQHEQRHS